MTRAEAKQKLYQARPVAADYRCPRCGRSVSYPARGCEHCHGELCQKCCDTDVKIQKLGKRRPDSK